MVAMLKKISLSEDFSIMKGYFVTKFCSFHYSSGPLFYGDHGLDVEWDSEHSSTFNYHSSEHNSVLLIFWKNICWWLFVEKEENVKASIGAVRVVYNSNDEGVFGIACCYYTSLIWCS